MPSFSTISQARLATCDSRLQDILNEVIQYVDFMVLEGYRGKDAQDLAVAQGKSTKPWPEGKHNAYPSRAVDIAPLSTQMGQKLSWKDTVAFGRLMGYVDFAAKRQGVKLRFGIDWDGDFRSVDVDPDEHFLDAPHVELL